MKLLGTGLKLPEQAALPPATASKIAWRPGAGGGASHHRVWLAATAFVVALGAIISVLASTSMASGSASRSRQSFVSSSDDIAATLQLSILHEQDLMNSAGGFIADDPYASNLEFAQWAVTVNAFARYPEVMGFGYSVIVTAAEFPVFASVAESDPVGTLAQNGTLEVIPPGKRTTASCRIGCRATPTSCFRLAVICVHPAPSGP